MKLGRFPNPLVNKAAMLTGLGALGYGVWQFWKNRNAMAANNEGNDMDTSSENTFPFGNMRSEDGKEIALKSVAISGEIEGMFFGWKIRQEYKNETADNLEIIYTFPLGWGSSLLGMEAIIGEKKLRGQVVENSEAEEKYEKAISDGDSAIMVQQSARGLYTANLGNIAAGESVVVELSCAKLLNFDQGRARLCIPTVVGERYGDPYGPDGLAPHESVKMNPHSHYPFTLELVIKGEAASGNITCPSHAVSINKNGSETTVKLEANAVLDRDFFLLLDGVSNASQALCAPDGNEYLLAASFQPKIPHAEISPVGLKILVDCSGSMSGESISEAKKGLSQILKMLRPEDYLSYSRFGSDVKHYSKNLMPCSPAALTKFSAAIDGTEADMGGTEMKSALKSVFADIGNPTDNEIAPMVLVITDGDVWGEAQIVAEAKKSGHRIFVIGVGYAPGESLLRDMAEKTGGACELVSPKESIAAAIIRMFNRMRGTIAKNIRIDWPEKPLWQTPLPRYLYDGETVHSFAILKNRPETGPILSWLADGKNSQSHARLEFTANEDVVRLGHARQIEEAELTDKEKLEIALKYQLVTEQTSLILVYVRADKIKQPPRVQQIPQMAAHGHGCFLTSAACCFTGGGIVPGIFGRAFDRADRIIAEDMAEDIFHGGDQKIPANAGRIYEIWKANLYADGTMTAFIKAAEAEFPAIAQALGEIANNYGVSEETVWAYLVREIENWLKQNSGLNVERHSSRLINAALRDLSPTDQELLEAAINEKFVIG